ncbi:hypothetical protein ACSYAE_04950 [Edwardsiella tarda]|uniref:hypothetical protein n=1 Tax=Edwardsiella tarda TaxID=636 RepID=UPI003F65E905
MNRVLLVIIMLWSVGAIASTCYQGYSEKGLISSVGKKPEKKTVKTDDGVTKVQYEFRKEPTPEEAFSDDSESKFEPQFYITIYDPKCPSKIKIWFDGGDHGINESNVELASSAWSYLTGSNPDIFKNKLRKFSEVQKFESHDEKANSLFVTVGGVYFIDVYLK